MIVTVGLCAVAHFSECFLARGIVWLHSESNRRDFQSLGFVADPHSENPTCRDLLSRFGFTRNDITIKNRKKTAVKIIPSHHVLTGIEKISSHTHQGNAGSKSRPDFAGSMPTKLLAHAIGGVGNSDYEWQQKRLASKLAVAKRVGKWEYRNLARKKVSFRKPGFSRLGSKLL
jgi:hypothetical protein